MKADDIRLDDLWRILVGQVPASFFIEVIIRTAVIYLVLMISMRLLGKRMAGQLNKLEMISMTTLAAAVGVPLQAPDRGLLPVLIIAAIVILLGRAISILTFHSKKFENVSQDRLTVLVQDSILQLDALKKTKITRERLFAFLRSKGSRHLGVINKVYLEAGGFFTVVKHASPKPGLIIIPRWDEPLIEKIKVNNVFVCGLCGAPFSAAGKRCEVCGHTEMQAAGL